MCIAGASSLHHRVGASGVNLDDVDAVAFFNGVTDRTRKAPGFAGYLRELCDYYGGQLTVAEDIGIGQGLMNRWATGKSEPTLRQLLILAVYFGISLDELLCVAPARAIEARRLEIEDDWTAWVDKRRCAGFSYVLRQKQNARNRRFIRTEMRKMMKDTLK